MRSHLWRVHRPETGLRCVPDVPGLPELMRHELLSFGTRLLLWRARRTLARAVEKAQLRALTANATAQSVLQNGWSLWYLDGLYLSEGSCDRLC